MSYDDKRVFVAVRVRPKLPAGVGSRVQQEEWQWPDSVNMVDDQQMILREQKQDESCRQSQFTFDSVFDQDITQSEVYEEAVQELVDAALGGINSTILAYGQTGSGKTHTVLGDVQLNPLSTSILTHNSGLFLRVLKDLFEYRRRREGKAYVTVSLSCIEIYCDSARDLLSDRPQEDIKISMTDEHVYMPTLTREQIWDLHTVYKHFKVASSRRMTRATDANDVSSRSHALFVIDVVQQEVTDKNPTPPDLSFLNDPPQKLQHTFMQGKDAKGKAGRSFSPGGRPRTASPTPAGGTSQMVQDEMRSGACLVYRKDEPPLILSKIVLADLAGSERQSGKAGGGQVAGTAGHKEMVNINKSLTSLGNVVHALHEGSSHVPYRDATLTRVLRPSFASPSSKVLLISNLSPTQLTYDESWSTLQFANKVKAMKVSNSTVSADQQQLAFDFLEVQKMWWSLIGDHHICNLFYEVGEEDVGMVRRHGDLIAPPFGLHRLRKKAQEKDRTAALRDIIPLAKRDKERILQKIERRKQEEQQRLQKMKEDIRQEEIDRYEAEVANYHRKLAEFEEAKRTHRSKLDADVRERQAQISLDEQAIAVSSNEQAAIQRRIQHAEQQFAQLTSEGNRLVEERKKKQAAAESAKTAEDREREDHENRFAWSMWGHCKAQQFYLRFKAYRETQLSFYEAQRQNFGRISQALNEAKKLAKYLKEGAGDGKGGQRPPPQGRPRPPASPAQEGGTPATAAAGLSQRR